MSSTGGSSGNAAFDHLLTLAKFVQSPEFHQRATELRDLEASANAALAESQNAAVELEAAKREHAADKTTHFARAQQLASDLQAFERRRDKLNKAIAELRKALE